MRKFLTGVCAAVFALGLNAAEASEGLDIPEREWSFTGVFGAFDRAELQRGFQVHKEVCAGCHSLNFIAFRNLADLGFSEAEVKAIAAEYTIIDGPDDEGEMFERAGRPSDYFPAPFANDKAAAAANNGAVPPDLSVIIKARVNGTNYMHALMTGYEELPENFKELPEFGYLPEKFEPLEGVSFNKYYPGFQTAMPPPLSEDAVEYADGTAASVEQMATDVTVFLMWAAEPNLEARKKMGIKVMIFLLVFTGVLYAAKRKIWADLH
jgi:ubiquinol-cytochrome c reductase cytochrome c1 subunit